MQKFSFLHIRVHVGLLNIFIICYIGHFGLVNFKKRLANISYMYMYICMHVEPSKNNTVFHKNTCSVEIINTSTCIMEIFFFIIYSSKFLDYWFTASNAFNKHPKTGRISFYLSVKVAQTCIFFYTIDKYEMIG